MTPSDEIQLEEYRSLQEEHRRNRSLVFERPLVILGLIAVAMGYSYQSVAAQFVPPVLILILWYNLWFTVNRLQSDARITAYLHLVHEGERRRKWIGWESALRHYRKWMSDHVGAEQVPLGEFGEKVAGQTCRFYQAIWLLHVVLACLAFVVTLVKWSASRDTMSGAGVGISFPALIVFFIYAFGSLRHSKVLDSMAREREKWQLVFNDLDKLKS